MKKVVVVSLAILFALQTGFAQSDNGTARIQKIQGIEVYAMCEPLRAYEVQFDVETGAKAASLMTGGVVNEGVSEKLTQFVARATKESKKQNKPFDAIVYNGGKKVVAVKFKDDASEATKGLGKVRKMEGVEVYVMSEPVRDYTTAVDVSTGVKAKSYLTGGLVNNSIEEDMAQYVRRAINDAKEQNKAIEAVVYSGGKRSIGVTFK